MQLNKKKKTQISELNPIIWFGCLEHRPEPRYASIVNAFKEGENQFGKYLKILTLRVVLRVKEIILDGLEKYLKKSLMAGETPLPPKSSLMLVNNLLFTAII